MGRFDHRLKQREILDDLSISDGRLTAAMEELRVINRFLGGHAATMSALKPFLRARPNRPVHILDVGTGIGDYAEVILRWCAYQTNGAKADIVGVDANRAAVEHARRNLARRLPDALFRRVCIHVADAHELPYEDNSFDVVICAMLLHHFQRDQIVKVASDMQRISRYGIVINDLHRHPLAYHGFAAWTLLTRSSPVVRRDGLLSVRKGFTREDLEQIARDARLEPFSLKWRWAFRWVLSTLET